jgi:hypothetical protein
MHSQQDSVYISRRLSIEPGGKVLDMWYRGLPLVPVLPRFVRFGIGLWLSTTGLRADPHPQVLRAVPGILWFGCWPVRVLVEMVEWSGAECELTIRPRSYLWPVWTDAYSRRAATCLDRLHESLLAVEVRPAGRT